MKSKVAVFWFRRDLRMEDNVGLSHALNGEFPVLPIFIFDQGILNKLENKKDRRVDYIHQALTSINSELKQYNSTLNVLIGKPIEIFSILGKEYDIQAVYG